LFPPISFGDQLGFLPQGTKSKLFHSYYFFFFLLTASGPLLPPNRFCEVPGPLDPPPFYHFPLPPSFFGPWFFGSCCALFSPSSQKTSCFPPPHPFPPPPILRCLTLQPLATGGGVFLRFSFPMRKNKICSVCRRITLGHYFFLFFPSGGSVVLSETRTLFEVEPTQNLRKCGKVWGGRVFCPHVSLWILFGQPVIHLSFFIFFPPPLPFFEILWMGAFVCGRSGKKELFSP